MQKILLDLWTLAQPVLLVLSTVLAGWLSMKFSRYLDTQSASKLQEQLRQAMVDAASTIYQRQVKDLKDPARPGVFDKDAQKKAARDAIALVTGTHGASVEKLRGYGIDVNQLLEQLLERAVVDLDARTSTPALAPARDSKEIITLNASAPALDAPVSKDSASGPKDGAP